MPRTSGGHNQAELIKLAITGIDAQIRELQETRARLTQSATGGAKSARRGPSKSASPGATTAPRKRVFSAATRKRLSLAAKRRWARIRNEKKGK
jgi:hypothetical protein